MYIHIFLTDTHDSFFARLFVIFPNKNVNRKEQAQTKGTPSSHLFLIFIFQIYTHENGRKKLEKLECTVDNLVAFIGGFHFPNIKVKMKMKTEFTLNSFVAFVGDLEGTAGTLGLSYGT